MESLTTRWQDIERAKGLAILLVVFGHIVAQADPLRVTWYGPIRHAIYTFHMPFFLYLSGFAARLSGGVLATPDKWRGLFASRARRLLVPFFALGAFIVLGKVVAGQFIYVDHRPASLASGMADLIWHTAASSALSVWYLFVLFTLSVATPILVWADHGRLRLALLAMALCYFIPLPQYIYLDHIGKYAIFFAIGAGAAGQLRNWDEFVDRYWVYLFIILCGALLLVMMFGKYWPDRLTLLPIGIISMPALHGLVRHVSHSAGRVFYWLGQNSLMIYLFNTICIGVAKGVMLRVTTWNGSHFLPFAVLLMLSGSLGPIALKKTIFQRVKLIDRYTR